MKIEFKKTSPFFRDFYRRKLRITDISGRVLTGVGEEVKNRNFCINGDWVYIPDIIKVEIPNKEGRYEDN